MYLPQILCVSIRRNVHLNTFLVEIIETVLYQYMVEMILYLTLTRMLCIRGNGTIRRARKKPLCSQYQDGYRKEWLYNKNSNSVDRHLNRIFLRKPTFKKALESISTMNYCFATYKSSFHFFLNGILLIFTDNETLISTHTILWSVQRLNKKSSISPLYYHQMNRDFLRSNSREGSCDG